MFSGAGGLAVVFGFGRRGFRQLCSFRPAGGGVFGNFAAFVPPAAGFSATLQLTSLRRRGFRQLCSFRPAGDHFRVGAGAIVANLPKEGRGVIA